MNTMRVQSPCSSPAISDQYRRRARRLRHNLRNHPSRLHRSLQRLASETNDRPTSSTSSIIPTSPAARRFEILVREVMERGPMRYSQRLAMLKTAAAMGLGRFEANLILAIEQNRQFPPTIEQPSRHLRGLATFLCVAFIQGLILTTAWWIFVR
jgi:hypothetical protein